MPKPLLIAGGGIGGLTLAALLHRRGRECLVLERASRVAPVGAGLVLQPNAIRALRIGGIESAIVSRGAPLARMELRDDRGRILSRVEGQAFESAFGAGLSAFHRATLHAALLELVPAGAMWLGSHVQGFGETPDGVFAELESGERVEGEALVGADGVRSVVRGQLLDDGEPRYSGYTSWRGIAPRGTLWPSGHTAESWGAGARFGLVSIDGDRIYWFATANTSAGGTDTGKAGLRARFGGWHRPIPDVIDATPDEAILRTDIADRDPATRWSRGRVTLLGDAAHPMTPNLGQGGCQAIEDAVVLDLCLSATSDVAAAFAAYERRRLARTARVVIDARRFGRMGQLEQSAARAFRYMVVRLTPERVTLRSLRWLYDFDE
ncbi:MAG: FAD-dependent monooxygenase [Vicinamibacterales bacterium]